MQDAFRNVRIAAAHYSIAPPPNSSKALDLKKFLYSNYVSLRHGFVREAARVPEASGLPHRKDEPGFLAVENR